MRFLETFRRAIPWVNTEVLFLYMFCIELLFIFSFITCHLKILQCVEFNNFLSIAVCSVLLLFHNVCPEYSWIPPAIIKFTAFYSHRKRKLIEKNKEFSSILKRTDSSAFRARVCLFFFSSGYSYGTRTPRCICYSFGIKFLFKYIAISLKNCTIVFTRV